MRKDRLFLRDASSTITEFRRKVDKEAFTVVGASF